MRCTGDFVRDPLLNVPIAINHEASKELARRVVVGAVRVLGAAATTTRVSRRCTGGLYRRFRARHIWKRFDHGVS